MRLIIKRCSCGLRLSTTWANGENDEEIILKNQCDYCKQRTKNDKKRKRNL